MSSELFAFVQGACCCGVRELTNMCVCEKVILCKYCHYYYGDHCASPAAYSVQLNLRIYTCIFCVVLCTVMMNISTLSSVDRKFIAMFISVCLLRLPVL